MKRTLASAIFLTVVFAAGFSQDKIITLKNDTIDCRIIKITRNSVYFEMTTKDVKSSGEMPRSNILNFITSDKPSPVIRKQSFSGSFEKLQISFNGGLGYLVASFEFRIIRFSGFFIEEYFGRDPELENHRDT